ncbi:MULTISPECIES: dipeptidase [Nocardiaceae]|uniref:dipeptidase n=1 Tax=Nocardiaceae TaxID=85025 RepID=UPI00068B3110|nr:MULTISPECIES: membrane dipeptidase [Rhodococcus]
MNGNGSSSLHGAALPADINAAGEPRDRHVVFDLHGHAVDVAPWIVRKAFELAPGMDPSFELECLSSSGIDAMVACVLGDPLGTVWRRPRDRWGAVKQQFDSVQRQAETAGAVVVRHRSEFESARARRRPAIVLGVEGADILGPDLERVTWLHDRGVRMVGLVHYSDNALGTIGTTVCGQPRSRRVRRGTRSAGLTNLGREAIRRMNSLGILVDVAHADQSTTMAACETSNAPIVASHTGVAALDDLARYITDAEIKAIAATGGLIGLWPFRLGARGMADARAFAHHAAHIADLVGVEHLGIGTDANGGPSTMAEYAGPQDHSILRTGLSKSGFSDEDCALIMGGNALRVFTEVCG